MHPGYRLMQTLPGECIEEGILRLKALQLIYIAGDTLIFSFTVHERNLTSPPITPSRARSWSPFMALAFPTIPEAYILPYLVYQDFKKKGASRPCACELGVLITKGGTSRFYRLISNRPLLT